MVGVPCERGAAAAAAAKQVRMMLSCMLPDSFGVFGLVVTRKKDDVLGEEMRKGVERITVYQCQVGSLGDFKRKRESLWSRTSLGTWPGKTSPA